MAIVCDRCRIENVASNGDICSECIKIEAESKIDRSYLGKIYLPTDLFEKFEQIHSQVLSEKQGAKKAMSKFMKTLGTSFINKFTGKEINDPTPRVIIPQEKTIDRIQKIINHNLAVYAKNNNLDTPEDLEDWSITDMYSDNWEQTLYQYVDNIQVMEPESFQNEEKAPPAPGETGGDVSAE